MIGLGTIVNVCAIVAGGLIGRGVGRRFPQRVQGGLLSACGVMVIFLGIGGTMAEMLEVSGKGLDTSGTMMMMASLIIGTLIGSLLDIEGHVEQFGKWLRRKTKNENDQAFVSAFVTASLTVCIGAMAIIGAIDDGIYGDHAILFTKAVIDFVIIAALSAALGPGTIFSAIPVGILQGTVTLLARLAAPVMTDAALANLSYVGDILITCVGINLLFPRKISVADMLPSLVVAVLWAFL
jgi:uncharacterized membrane protein YqgA involved in biofilm formation